MIICKACGFRNPDEEEFCSSCGRYLEWAGERVEEEPEAEPEAAPEPEPEPERRPGFLTRVRTRLGFPPKVRPHEGPEALETSEAPPGTGSTGSIGEGEEEAPSQAGEDASEAPEERAGELASETLALPVVVAEEEPVGVDGREHVLAGHRPRTEVPLSASRDRVLGVDHPPHRRGSGRPEWSQ